MQTNLSKIVLFYIANHILKKKFQNSLNHLIKYKLQLHQADVIYKDVFMEFSVFYSL